jgi:hypothetical protein
MGARMDVLLAVLIALAGGSVGTVLTQLLGASREVERHNRAIADRDEDLAQWIADEDFELRRRMGEIAQQASAQGVLSGGSFPAGRAKAKAITLHRYRDQRREAERFVAGIEVEEGWAHRLWRRSRGPLPSLQTPEKAQWVIAIWRDGLSEEDDPSRRSLDSILAHRPPSPM